MGQLWDFASRHSRMGRGALSTDPAPLRRSQEGTTPPSHHSRTSGTTAAAAAAAAALVMQASCMQLPKEENLQGHEIKQQTPAINQLQCVLR